MNCHHLGPLAQPELGVLRRPPASARSPAPPSTLLSTPSGQPSPKRSGLFPFSLYLEISPRHRPSTAVACYESFDPSGLSSLTPCSTYDSQLCPAQSFAVCVRRSQTMATYQSEHPVQACVLLAWLSVSAIFLPFGWAFPSPPAQRLPRRARQELSPTVLASFPSSLRRSIALQTGATSWPPLRPSPDPLHLLGHCESPGQLTAHGPETYPRAEWTWAKPGSQSLATARSA